MNWPFKRGRGQAVDARINNKLHCIKYIHHQEVTLKLNTIIWSYLDISYATAHSTLKDTTLYDRQTWQFLTTIIISDFSHKCFISKLRPIRRNNGAGWKCRRYHTWQTFAVALCRVKNTHRFSNLSLGNWWQYHQFDKANKATKTASKLPHLLFGSAKSLAWAG